MTDHEAVETTGPHDEAALKLPEWLRLLRSLAGRRSMTLFDSVAEDWIATWSQI